jgi:hypothetical protein
MGTIELLCAILDNPLPRGNEALTALQVMKESASGACPRLIRSY